MQPLLILLQKGNAEAYPQSGLFISHEEGRV